MPKHEVLNQSVQLFREVYIVSIVSSIVFHDLQDTGFPETLTKTKHEPNRLKYN